MLLCVAESQQGESMQNDSYNKGGFIAFLFSMAFSLLFFVYVVFVHPGINLKEVPEVAPAGETPQAGGAEQTKSVDMSKIDKPWVENDDVIAHGAQVFANNCAVCHGPKGLGDGPAGMSLNPKPRNFVEGKWAGGGDSISLFKTVQNGRPGTSMASFAHLPVTDRWSVIQFIRSITKNKIKDDPAKLEAFAKTAK
jgi:mono/diheme cytochrome c family protein